MKIEDYIEIINEKRPHIKPNSARTYAISLRSIAPKDATSMKWLSNVDYVLKQAMGSSAVSMYVCLYTV